MTHSTTPHRPCRVGRQVEGRGGQRQGGGGAEEVAQLGGSRWDPGSPGAEVGSHPGQIWKHHVGMDQYLLIPF